MRFFPAEDGDFWPRTYSLSKAYGTPKVNASAFRLLKGPSVMKWEKAISEIQTQVIFRRLHVPLA